MGQLSNDRFGITYFSDDNGKVWFQRDAAGNTTTDISQTTVRTKLAGWSTHRELKRHMATGKILSTGTGRTSQ